MCLGAPAPELHRFWTAPLARGGGPSRLISSNGVFVLASRTEHGKCACVLDKKCKNKMGAGLELRALERHLSIDPGSRASTIKHVKGLAEYFVDFGGSIADDEHVYMWFMERALDLMRMKPAKAAAARMDSDMGVGLHKAFDFCPSDLRTQLFMSIVGHVLTRELFVLLGAWERRMRRKWAMQAVTAPMMAHTFDRAVADQRGARRAVLMSVDEVASYF